MNDTIRIAGVVKESIVDGPGIRYVIFTQGCPHKCVGCHNPHTFDKDGGYDKNIDEILKEIKSNPLLTGVTFSGGEPFLQAQKLTYLAQEIHKMNLNILTYTGFTFEQLMGSQNDNYITLLKATDILIDGRFELEQKSLDLRFRGSKNQRIIDVKETLKNNNITTILE